MRLDDLNPRTAALLCYVPILGWIASVFVLAASRFRYDRETRFHAFQGLYLFVAWLLIDWVIAPLFAFSPSVFRFSVSKLLHAVVLGAWIWMLIKVAQRENFKLPILGDLAEKSVAEQN